MSEEADELLILEVQKNPILYDKSLPEYKRADKKEDVWSDIAKRIGITGEHKQLSFIEILSMY